MTMKVWPRDNDRLKAVDMILNRPEPTSDDKIILTKQEVIDILRTIKGIQNKLQETLK